MRTSTTGTRLTETRNGGGPSRAVVFRNVRVVLPHSVTAERHLLVRNGLIEGIMEEMPDEKDLGVIEAAGYYAAPGLIDIHCHSDGETSFFKNVNKVAANLLKSGTTGVLATLAYADMKARKLHQQVETLWKERNALARKTVLGVHLEGPYTNPKYGALVHAGNVHAPDPKEYQPVLEQWSKVVRLWTLAPELPGAGAFIDAASSRGIILAAGHTEAGADLLAPLVMRGLRVATHWANACGTPPSRLKGTHAPGILEFALLSEDMMAEVICDFKGYHVAPMMVGLLYRVKGPDHVILITDAYWSQVKDGAVGMKSDVHLTADGQLCGSRLSMIEAARNIRKITGCSLPEVFRMGALNPARLFGWQNEMGSLEAGRRANIIIIDEHINIHGVWLAGRRVNTII